MLGCALLSKMRLFRCVLLAGIVSFPLQANCPRILLDLFSRLGPYDLRKATPLDTTTPARQNLPQGYHDNRRYLVRRFPNNQWPAVEHLFETLEQKSASGHLRNYHEWFADILRQDNFTMKRRVYEGWTAAFLLRNPNVRVAFEPKGGFFSLRPSGKTEKSMDLEVRAEIDGKEVLSYQEVKVIADRRFFFRSLESSIYKALAARRDLGADIELGAVLYIQDSFQYENALLVLCQKIMNILNARHAPGLNSVKVVDLGLSQVARIQRNSSGQFSASISTY